MQAQPHAGDLRAGWPDARSVTPVCSLAWQTFAVSNLALLGDMTTGQEYSQVTSAAVPVPLLVAVGDELEYARLTVYADSNKASVKGRRVQSYKVAAEGPRSAFVTFTAKAYDASDGLLYTESVRYRVTAERQMAMVGIEAQYGTGAAGHFVYTPAP
jgi:hypothetical protein